MPYDKPSDAPDHVPDDLKAQWLKVFNSVYEKEKSNGASDKDAEAKAFAEANGVIKKESKSMSTKTEYRAFATELRAKRDDGQPAKIEGYAAVFGQQADLGWFKESIRQGAFTRALKEKQDVRALFNHNPDHVLGRTTSGTLRLSEDEHGLRFEVDMPDTMMGQDVYKMIQRGDISQCSFGFRVNAEDVTYDDKGGATREITDADLFDVSPVTYPAYEQTSVEARSVAEYRTALDEARAEQKTLKVDGEELGPHDFFIVGDSQDTSTWHLPWHFKSEGKTLAHLRDALARINQMKGVSAEVMQKAKAKLDSLCKAHGIHVDEEKAAELDLETAKRRTHLAELTL